MLKFIFEYLTDSYSLLENPLDNYIIMAVVGFVTFLIAYAIVGWLYEMHMIEGSGVGSILHWSLRLVIFVGINYAVATAIRVYKWLTGIPTYIWWILITAMVGIAVIVIIVKIVLYRKSEFADKKRD